MQSKEIFVGIDVSKLTLDVAVHGMGEHIRIANNSEGFRRLLSWLKSLSADLCDCRFVMEHTGGYEYRLVQFCVSKNLRFTRVAGLEIKKSMGMQRGKNDKIDARRISEYGYEKRDRLKADTPCHMSVTRLKQLLTQRSGFVNDRKANEHRMKELMAMMDYKASDVIIKNYRRAVDFAEKMVTKTEAEISKLISADPAVSTNYKLLTSIPGIGPVNAWTTLAFTNNFESFTNGRKYGACCGVVPYDYSSGTSIKGRSRVSHMANKTIKAELTMAAKAAVTHDPEMKAYYRRRESMGKHHMSILNEVRFKLILRMFAVVNKGQPYVKNQQITT